MTPTPTQARVVAISGLLGRLRKNGMRRVRIDEDDEASASRATRRTSRTGTASRRRRRPQIITANVAKSKIELIGPKNDMKRRMKPMSHCAGRCEQLLVDVVGRDRHLADVVEQVVEQDLRRQHRQEAQEQRRAGGAEHVPEVRRRAHQDVLDRVGEDPPALDDAVGEDPEVLVEQHDVGGVLGDVRRRVDGDADVGVVQRDRVVDAVAEEPDVGAERPLRLMTRDFCSGVTRAKIVVLGSAAASCVVVEPVELGAR